MHSHKKILIIALSLVYCFNFGIALVCFTCASPENGICGDDFSHDDIAAQACRPNENVCIKGSSTVLGVTILTRNCGVEEVCTMFDQCNFCNESLCNSSNIYIPKHFTFSLLTILLITFLL